MEHVEQCQRSRVRFDLAPQRQVGQEDGEVLGLLPPASRSSSAEVGDHRSCISEGRWTTPASIRSSKSLFEVRCGLPMKIGKSTN